VDGIERIRFTSPHPRGFKDDLINAYRDLPKLCHYVHLPVQSGSNRILRAMNRPYSRERYLQIVGDLKSAAPDMFLSTDIIVGFPGETEADFELTCDLFDQVGYEMAYIFKYSTRSGTPAAEMGDQVDKAVKEERNRLLLEKLAARSLVRNRSLIGTTQEILVEGPARRGEGLYTGRTGGNRRAVFPARERLIGEIVTIRVEDATTSTLHGSLVLQGLESGAGEDPAKNLQEREVSLDSATSHRR
jgi:tRNA-2-methylthio-N6-dimethylallyladenosine synthase